MGGRHTHIENSKEAFGIQRLMVGVGVLLFLLKMVAYYLTGSVAILSDALESIINIVTAFLGLYSLRFSMRPKDRNHPYGHGKVEFLSSGFEGLLILFAGLLIIYEAVYHLIVPKELKGLDMGMLIIAITAVLNYLLGAWSTRKGRQASSPVLISGGKHLQADAFTTLGVFAGLFAVSFTGWQWLDSAVAVVFGLLIIRSAHTIIRSAMSGIMDEADEDLLEKVVEIMEQRRKDEWVDFHNLRIIRYAHSFHIDAHLTLPWYYSIRKAHNAVDAIEEIMNESFTEQVELFIHTDPCVEASCKICALSGCKERKHAQEARLNWTIERVLSNAKHQTER